MSYIIVGFQQDVEGNWKKYFSKLDVGNILSFGVIEDSKTTFLSKDEADEILKNHLYVTKKKFIKNFSKGIFNKSYKSGEEVFNTWMNSTKFEIEKI